MFRIPLVKPYITEETKKRVCDVLDSGHLTEGAVTRELEQAFEQYTAASHALAVTSCTTGLEVALRAIGVGPGDEVIVPDFTFPATADAVAIVGATVVVADVSSDTFLIDYDAIEQALTDRTKAIMPVSEFGNPLDYDRLNSIKEKYGVFIIEDAACALGSEFQGIMTGSHADISVFSLHPRKFITTGEGGIITTNCRPWHRWMESYKHFGINGVDTSGLPRFERIGTNFKLSNILAAVGLVQMKQVDKLLSLRRSHAENYLKLLAGARGVDLPVMTDGGRHSWQSFCIKIPERDRVLRSMRKEGIEVQIGAYALHLQPAFRPSHYCRFSGDYVGSRQAHESGLVLPLYHDLALSQQEEVIAALKALL